MYRPWPCLGLAIYKLYQVLTKTLLLHYYIITNMFGLNESIGLGYSATLVKGPLRVL